MILKCPNCSAKYDPGYDDSSLAQFATMDVSVKCVCPHCEQWLLLPERKPCSPPNVPDQARKAMKAQAKLVDLPPEPGSEPRERGSGRAPIVLRCTKCNAKLRTPGDSSGQSIRCPKCSTKVKVPAHPDDEWNDFEDQKPSRPTIRRPKKQSSPAGALSLLQSPNTWWYIKTFWSIPLSAAVIIWAALQPASLTFSMLLAGMVIFGLAAFITGIMLCVRAFYTDLEGQILLLPLFLVVISTGISIWSGGVTINLLWLVPVSFLSLLVFCAPLCVLWVPKAKRQLLQPHLTHAISTRVAQIACVAGLFILAASGGHRNFNRAVAADPGGAANWQAAPNAAQAAGNNPGPWNPPQFPMQRGMNKKDFVAKFAAGDAVRVKYLDRVYSAIVHDQPKVDQVEVSMLRVEEGNPFSPVAKREQIVVPLTDVSR